MKHITAALLLSSCFFFHANAQTVTTITSGAVPIDDDIIFDAAGNLYGSDYVGNSIYKRTADGVESAFTSGLSSPNGLAFLNDTTLIVADNTGNKLYKVFPDGSKQIFVDPLPGPSGVLRLPDSDTFLVTSYTMHKVWKVASDGTVSDYLVHPDFNGPVGLCFDDAENLYVANFNDRKIFRVTPDGQINFFVQPSLGQYIGFIAYANGFIYATAMNANKIYKIDLDGNDAVWLGSSIGSTDGDASVAKFNRPNGIRASASGDTLYVSDFGSKRVRMITNLGGASATHTAFLSDQQVSVAPNPAGPDIRIGIEVTAATELSAALYDANGRRVYEIFPMQRKVQGLYRYSIDATSLTPGLYFLQLRAATGARLVKKVVVE
ncbi:MAG: T9SS type A sorting domain-containing protein [Saprospiraceae bacterium]|nr:T9SS type A sorting domain-containing protein [Saprospiraceae bacterium]